MKTQFDSIVKIKKQDVEKIEMQIAGLNSQIARKFDEIAQYQDQMRQCPIPSHGSMQDFRAAAEFRRAYLFQIDSLHLEISKLKKQRAQAQEFHRLACIEYEKSKYLQENIQKKIILSLKRQEEKSMDEAASLCFNQQKD